MKSNTNLLKLYKNDKNRFIFTAIFTVYLTSFFFYSNKITSPEQQKTINVVFFFNILNLIKIYQSILNKQTVNNRIRFYIIQTKF